MGLFNSRRRQKQREKEIFSPENEGKGQFNVVIDKELRTKVQELAQRLRVNQSVLTEHLLQVALFYTTIAIKDEDKKSILEKHLISTHLLDKNLDDEEVAIRLTESNQNWMLLMHSKQVIARVKRAMQAMDMAVRTRNQVLFQKAERDLREDVLRFAEWIIEHRFDDATNNQTEYPK